MIFIVGVDHDRRVRDVLYKENGLLTRFFQQKKNGLQLAKLTARFFFLVKKRVNSPVFF